MDKKFLKHKGKVSETEFLEYLEKICKNKNIKEIILEFYEILKSSDKKFGKMYTIKSFGRTPENSPLFPLYTDQAKYLFLSKEDQEKDDALIFEFTSALKNNEEILDENLRKEANDKAFEIYRTKQDKLFSLDTEPIGASDLFRFQFVNFVDTINIEEGLSHHPNGTRGYYNALNKELRLFNITDELFNKKDTFQYFKLQNTIYHELTHMFSMKTANTENNPIFTSPGVMAIMEKTHALVNPQILELLRKNRFILDAFMFAEEILNEVATDYYSLYLSNRLVSFYNFATPARPNAPGRLYGALSADQKFEDLTLYTDFGHIFEIIFRNNNFARCICNTEMPVWGQYYFIKDFLESNKISNQLGCQIDHKLSEIFNIEQDMFKTISQFDKFQLLIGTCFYFVLEKKGSPFDENMMLAQSMIFDIMQNSFLKNLAEKKHCASLAEFSGSSLKAFLTRTIKTAEAVDKWAIKPNIKTNDNDVCAHEALCNTKLSEIAPQNPAIQTWAKYLQTLCTSLHKLAPEMIETSALLKKEFEFLNQTKSTEFNALPQK